LAQICTKSFVGWGFAPDPTGGAYSAPPDSLAGLRGPTSKGRGGTLDPHNIGDRLTPLSESSEYEDKSDGECSIVIDVVDILCISVIYMERNCL